MKKKFVTAAIVTLLMSMAMPIVSFGEEITNWTELRKRYGNASKWKSEPTVGVWCGSYNNRQYVDKGVFAELFVWRHIKDTSFDFGAGIVGMTSKGRSIGSTYKGRQSQIGPEIGLQNTIATGPDALRKQWQIKARLAWFRASGSNNEGYWSNQRNLLPGIYAENLWETTEAQLQGWIFEGWADIFSPLGFSSSWQGFQAEGRSSAKLSYIYQRQLSEDWAVRGVISGIWQEWGDVDFGPGLNLEFRYKNTLMFGPGVSYFGAWNFIGGARLELQWWLKNNRKQRMLTQLNYQLSQQQQKEEEEKKEKK